MNKHITFAIVLLVLLVGAIAAWRLLRVDEYMAKPSRGEDVTVKVLVGGEKMNFLSDAKVQFILKSRYGITLDSTKVGSIEMVSQPNVGVDGLWPSSQIASEIYRSSGGTLLAAENIFNSAIVAYASTEVADALVKAKIAEVRDGSVYIIDCKKLFDNGSEGFTWASLNLPRMVGRVKVYSSDPTTSNSGLVFAGLLANILNGSEVVTEVELPKIGPQVVAYFKRLGIMERSTSDLFQGFLSNPKSKPIVIGYENQVIEYGLQHPDHQGLLRAQIRVLYPVPTVWSEHPFIAVTGNGKRALEALKDPEIQKIAWEEHGFRSGLMGVVNDPKVLQIGGIPKSVDSVISVPSASVMQKLILWLNQGVPVELAVEATSSH